MFLIFFQIGLWTPVSCLQSPGGASDLSLEENQTGLCFWQYHSGGVFLRSHIGYSFQKMMNVSIYIERLKNLLISLWKTEDDTLLNIVLVSLHQYVTLRTRYSELMTLTSQYIKFITDSQRRLEDDEVRDNWLRIPYKLNPNINLTNPIINHPTNKMTCRSLKNTCMHPLFSVCHTGARTTC